MAPNEEHLKDPPAERRTSFAVVLSPLYDVAVTAALPGWGRGQVVFGSSGSRGTKLATGLTRPSKGGRIDMVDLRKLLAGALAGVLLLGAVGCSEENPTEESGDLDFPANVDDVPAEVDDGVE